MNLSTSIRASPAVWPRRSSSVDARAPAGPETSFVTRPFPPPKLTFFSFISRRFETGTLVWIMPAWTKTSFELPHGGSITTPFLSMSKISTVSPFCSGRGKTYLPFSLFSTGSAVSSSARIPFLSFAFCSAVIPLSLCFFISSISFSR